jgi:hypothetical protein
MRGGGGVSLGPGAAVGLGASDRCRGLADGPPGVGPGSRGVGSSRPDGEGALCAPLSRGPGPSGRSGSPSRLSGSIPCSS